ncbi:MAG: DNA repair protein RecN [Candidatus Azobacteroides sp.]|nr:DNA repair protein RecN [Candidatus Azobacteroides sp.]
MLTKLHVRNYALISRLEIDLKKGFYVLTGETGAGKSILIGALSLISGQRADSKSIKSSEDKCIVDATFDISSYHLNHFFEENDIDYNDECILRREIYASGKSRAFVNDTPVSLSTLKDLANALIDIHSQNQNQLLSDNRFQLKVVDALAGNQDLLNEYEIRYAGYKNLVHRLEKLTEEAEKSKADEEYDRFQYNQLSEAKLKEGEQAGLESELETHTHAEEIKSGLYKISRLLDGEESGVLNALRNAVNTASGLQKIYSSANEIKERIENAYIDLKDLSSEVETKTENIEFNPDRMDEINNRLNTIYSLQQKHRVQTIEELIAIEKSLGEKLYSSEHIEEQIALLQKEINEQLESVKTSGEKLSVNRKKAAAELEKNLIKRLSYLGMPNVRFSVDIEKKEKPGDNGLDDIRFLFSANKNIPLQPVAETASGGETARLMLCIKALIADATALPTIIFDEIDTGVSGEIADKMGIIMYEMSKYMQVITITHLPQIAARGDIHFKVYKEDTGDKTNSNIKQLTPEERITELAQMLSGAQVTDAAINNAKALLSHSLDRSATNQ